MTRLPSLLLLAACADGDGLLVDAPLRGFGYVDVRVDRMDLGVAPDAVTAVRVGDLPAYDLRADADGLTFTVQGGPPGEARVVAQTADGAVDVGAVVYAPPVDPIFSRMVAYGASLTQGVQDAVPTSSFQLRSPAAMVAQQGGAFLPLPVLADPLTPMMPSDVDETCRAPDVVNFILAGLLDTLDKLRDPRTGRTDLARARVTPEVEPHNVAVGNATIVFQRDGYQDDAETAVAQMLGRLTLEAEGDDLFAPLERLPIDRILALEPTLLISFDLYGNDAIFPLFNGQTVDDLPPVAELEEELALHLDLLAATGAEVVLAALPDITLLAQFTFGEEEARTARTTVAAYNAALRAEAERRPWLHVAPLDRLITVDRPWVDVDGTRVSAAPLGGLLSLDGLHFTDTGYALAANQVLEVLREELGVVVQDVDVAAVLARDPRRPEALRQAGVDPDCLP